MGTESTPSGITEQDRVLIDLLETHRHLMADPDVPRDVKHKASDRMKGVWRDLAVLQDPHGFENHLSEYIQRQYQRRNNPQDVDGAKRRKPLCRCERSRHVCEVKNGEVPSKIRSRDYEFLEKPDTQELAREYVQEHTGDIVVGEAMETYRNLRADIYSELSEITTMLTAGEPVSTGEDGEDAGEEQTFADGVESPSEKQERGERPTDATDGGGDGDD